MLTVDDSTTQSGPRRNLKKNQACLQCRRGKMKCDAAQPHCTNCIKAWQLLLETPGVPGTSAPFCDYDPVEGLIFTPETISDPTARVRAIQDQLAQLHGKLQEARDEAGYHHRQSHLKRRPTPSSRSTPSISSGNPSKRRRTTFSMDAATAQAGGPSESGFTILPPITADPLAEPQRRDSSSSSSANSGAPTPSRSRAAAAPETASTYGMMADLPPTETLEQLVDLFITNEPHASRIFHAQRLREAILPPSSAAAASPQSTFRPPCPAQRSGPTSSATPPSPPSKALLHAICASAARYVIPPASSRSSNGVNNSGVRSQLLLLLPPGFAEHHADKARRLINAALTEHQDTLYLEQDGLSSDDARRNSDENGAASSSQGGQTPSPTTSDASSSSASSATRTRMTSSRTGSRDDSPNVIVPSVRQSVMEELEDRDARKRRIRSERDSKLFADMVQPLIVLATYYYHEGRGPEVWADVGALTRAIMSLGLNHPPTEPSRRASPRENLLIAQEERKRAFWSTFMLDRLLSAGGWAHTMTEEDTVRNFAGNSALLSAVDFRELGVQRSPRPQQQQQQPQAQARASVHPKHPDSYSLLVDAVVLLGRITDFRTRARLNHRSPLAQSILTNRSNQGGDGLINFRDASFSFILAQDPILRWEFSQLSAELNGGVGYWSSYGISGKGRREGRMPLLFKYSIGLADMPDDGKGGPPRRRSMVDMDLFLAHMVHYAATILLHFPVASFNIQSRSHSHQSTPPSLNTPPCTIPSINTMGTELHSQPQHQQHQPQRPSPPSALDFHPAERLPSLFHPSNNNGESFASQHPVVVDTGAIVSASCMSDSRKECVDAARKIVDALALLRCTTFEIGHVHPFGATCWYIAGVVLLYEHRRWVDEGDMIQQTAISKDVQIIRLSLLKYGQRSGIGMRLEEQLTAIQERIAAPPRGTPQSEDSTSENPEEYRHDVIPVFPFDKATYQSLPKTCPPSWGGAPLPQALV